VEFIVFINQRFHILKLLKALKNIGKVLVTQAVVVKRNFVDEVVQQRQSSPECFADATIEAVACQVELLVLDPVQQGEDWDQLLLALLEEIYF